MSVMSPDELRFAVLSGDAKMIAKAPGIGSKTAQRIILDMRDKVSLEDTLHADADGGQAVYDAAFSDSVREAVEALTALGSDPRGESGEGCGADGGGGDSESFSETSHLRRPGTGKNCDDGD